MFGILDIWTYILGVICIVIIPGPSSLCVFSLAVQYGVRKAYFGILGIVMGDVILMLLTAVGTTSLFRTNPDLFILIKCIGAVYLSWIGIKLIYAAWYKLRNLDSTKIELATVDGCRPFAKGLFIDLLNPEAIIFYISFFVQFADPQYPNPILSFFILGIIMQTINITYLSMLTFTGAWLASLFQCRRWLIASAKGGAGALFIGFGFKLFVGTI